MKSKCSLTSTNFMLCLLIFVIPRCWFSKTAKLSNQGERNKYGWLSRPDNNDQGYSVFRLSCPGKVILWAALIQIHDFSWLRERLSNKSITVIWNRASARNKSRVEMFMWTVRAINGNTTASITCRDIITIWSPLPTFNLDNTGFLSILRMIWNLRWDLIAKFLSRNPAELT